MDDHALQTVEYRIRDLPTRSMTLFPSRAHVIRELNDVPLKSGINKVVIAGLSPTVDSQSITVQGIGKAATFTDVSFELVPNRELWHDIYPDSDDEDEDEDDDAKEEAIGEGKETTKLKALIEAKSQQLTLLADEQERSREILASAAAQVKLLDLFGKGLSDKECSTSIQDGLQIYLEERQKIFNNHMEGVVRQRQADKEIAALNKELDELKAKLVDKKKSPREMKQQEKEELRRAEAKKEKERIRKQREKFWPRSCYEVRITLDASPTTTSLSRRSSVSSISGHNPHHVEKESLQSQSVDAGTTCNLTLSYVTTSAFWSPSYDLALSTTTKTAQLFFDALITNTTSETWKNCKITISNSQTTLSTMTDAIPSLTTWRLRLAGKAAIFGDSGDISSSREERAQRLTRESWQNARALKPRDHLFGVDAYKATSSGFSALGTNNVTSTAAFGSLSQPRGFGVAHTNQSQTQGGGLFGASQSTQSPAATAFGAAYSQPAPSLFGMTSHSAQPQGTGLFGNRSQVPGNQLPKTDDGQDYGPGDEFNATPEAPLEMSFQESLFEETGLTTTYDLPGHKTLEPGPTASKQRVTHMTFTDVSFLRTIVAKYNPAAYLKATVRNASKATLLKGPANITLDSSFLGRSTLPLCSSGESFSLNLGIDPAIKVSDSNFSHTRTITITNTRASPEEPVELTVLDQIPVSEDETLRISTLHPRGLSVDGAAVSTGKSGRESQKDWGKSTAVLKKDGEVAWDVSLNAGRSAKLTLEYEVSMPSGEHAMQC